MRDSERVRPARQAHRPEVEEVARPLRLVPFPPNEVSVELRRDRGAERATDPDRVRAGRLDLEEELEPVRSRRARQPEGLAVEPVLRRHADMTARLDDRDLGTEHGLE